MRGIILNKFKAAIFDLDGTILDSIYVWNKINYDFLSKRNLEVPENYINEVWKRSFKEAAEYTIELFELNETISDIVDEWNERALFEYGNNVKLKTNAKKYMECLKERGVKLAVATALPKVLYEPVLKSNNIYHMFDICVSTDEVKRGKRFPDVYILTSERLGIRPEECIVFEDMPESIEGAKLANMISCGVYDEKSKKDEDLIRSISDYYIYNFTELL